MARAWRVIKTEHLAGALSGEGARRVGGRWNPIGMAAVYASDSLALAMLEVLVHFDTAQPMADYTALELDIPDDWLVTPPRSVLDFSWPSRASIPHTQALGRSLLVDRDSFALRIPSVIVQQECNFVINPSHRNFFPWLQNQLSRAPVTLTFDPRLAGPRSITRTNKTL